MAFIVGFQRAAPPSTIALELLCGALVAGLRAGASRSRPGGTVQQALFLGVGDELGSSRPA